MRDIDYFVDKLNQENTSEKTPELGWFFKLIV
jgi:hypothetical protein